jgi:hypothetical protein
MAETEVFVATIFNNKFLTEKVRDGYIRKYKGTADERARLYGEAVRRSGLLYPVFNKEFNVLPYNDIFIKEKWPVIRAIDPHPQIPVHVQWLAINPAGFAAIVDELICPENAKISVCSDLIKAKESSMHVIYGIIDTLGSTRQMDTGMTITQLFADNDVYCRNARKDFSSGHALVTQALQGVEIIDRETKQLTTLHKFHIYDNCIETIYQFAHCTWEAAVGTEKDPPEKQKKYRNHFTDLTRYLLKEIPFFASPETTNAPKSFFKNSIQGGRW